MLLALAMAADRLGYEGELPAPTDVSLIDPRDAPACCATTR
jgi:hypothetical protein